jgi:hypothetical protein
MAKVLTLPNLTISEDGGGGYQLICARIPKPLIVAPSKPAIFVPGGTVVLVAVIVGDWIVTQGR